MTPTPATTPQSPSAFDPAAGNDGPESRDLAQFLRGMTYEQRSVILAVVHGTAEVVAGMCALSESNTEWCAYSATLAAAECLDELIA